MCLPNGSVNVNQTRTLYTHSELNHQDDLRQSDTTGLFQDGNMVMQKVQTLHSGHTNTDHTDVPFYDNKGFLPDDQRRNKVDGDVADGLSDGSGSYTEDDSGKLLDYTHLSSVSKEAFAVAIFKT